MSSDSTPSGIGRAEAGPLIDALRDDAPATRLAVFDALTRLPLEPDCWFEVREYVMSALWEGETTGALVAAGLGGAVAGAFVGGLVSVGSAMPRNPQAWDTYLLEHGDQVCIGVTLTDGQHASTASVALRAAGATSVEQRSIHQLRWRR